MTSIVQVLGFPKDLALRDLHHGGERVLVQLERILAEGQGAKRNCAVCHNPDFSGRDQMPRLAAQREDYLLKAMRDYKKGERIGYGSATMPEELAGLGEADLVDIAHYLAHGAR